MISAAYVNMDSNSLVQRGTENLRENE